MATLISLNNQSFWTPPEPHSAKPRHKHSPVQSQNQDATLPANGLDTCLSRDTVVILSDEDSDSDDTGDAQDDEAGMADYLPSIPEIIAKLEAERGRADTAGKQARPTPMHLDEH
jgi:hypothetical protein